MAKKNNISSTIPSNSNFIDVVKSSLLDIKDINLDIEGVDHKKLENNIDLIIGDINKLNKFIDIINNTPAINQANFASNMDFILNIISKLNNIQINSSINIDNIKNFKNIIDTIFLIFDKTYLELFFKISKLLVKIYQIDFNNLLEKFQLSLSKIKELIECANTYKNIELANIVITGIFSFMTSVWQISKLMSLLILFTPIYTSFIALSPIIYTALMIILKIYNALINAADKLFDNWIKLELFGIMSMALLRTVKILTRSITKIQKLILNTNINLTMLTKLFFILITILMLSSILKLINMNGWPLFIKRKIKILLNVTKLLGQIISTLNKIPLKKVKYAVYIVIRLNIVILGLILILTSLLNLAIISFAVILFYPVILLGLKLVSTVLKSIIKLLKGSKITNNSLKILRKMMIDIVKITLLMSSLLILMKLINFNDIFKLFTFLGLLTIFIAVCAKILKIILKYITKKTHLYVKRLMRIILLIGILAAEIVLISKISMLAMTAMFIIIPFLLSILALLFFIKLILSNASKFISKGSVKTINMILSIIFLLTIIAFNIMLLSLMSIIVIKNILNIITFFAIVFAILFITNKLLIYVKTVINKNTFKTLGLILIIMSIILVIAVELLILSIIASIIMALIFNVFKLIISIITLVIIFTILSNIINSIKSHLVKLILGLFLINIILLLLLTTTAILFGIILLSKLILNDIGTLLLYLLALVAIVVVLLILGAVINLATPFFSMAIIGLLIVNVLLLALLVTTAILFGIILLSKLILNDIGTLLLYLLALVAIVVVLLILGAVVSLAMPVFAISIIGLLAFTILLIILTAICGLLIILSMEAVKINDHIVDILLTLTNIIAVISMVAVVGYLASLALPILMPAIIGLALIGVIIGIVLLIGLLLLALQNIKLNFALITKNLKTIFDTLTYILENVFGLNNKNNENGGSQDKSYLSDLLSYFGSGLVSIIKSILVISYLALAVFIIFMILLIASMLKLIQVLNLDLKQILNSVLLVLDTVNMITNLIFNLPEKEGEKSTKLGLFSGFIDKFMPKLHSILDAIFAISFLALSVIVVLLIVFIAAELKIIQALKLDTNAIKENVQLVFDTVNMITDLIFNQPEKEGEDSAKLGIFRGFIDEYMPNLRRILDAIFAIYFLALSVIVVLLVVFIATELKIIQALKLDTNTIKENVQLVLDTVNMITDLIFNQPEKEGKKSTKRGIFGEFINKFMPKLSRILDAIFAISFLALSVISVAIIVCLAQLLKILQEIKLNPETIQSNVETVLKVCQSISNSIYREDEPEVKESKGIFGKLLDWLMPDALKSIIDAISAVGFLAASLSSVEIIGKLAENLKKINTVGDLSTIENKTIEVILACKRTMNAIYNTPIEIDVSEDKIKEFINKIQPINDTITILQKTISNILVFNNRWLPNELSLLEKVKSMFSIITIVNDLKPITDFSDIYNSMNEIHKLSEKLHITISDVQNIYKRWLPDEDDLEDKIENIFSIIEVVNDADIDEPKYTNNLNAISRLNNVLKTFTLDDKAVANTKKIADYTTQIIDKVDGANLEKLKTTEKIFKNMADFSKTISGNFEGLADALNEKIAPLLEELKELIGEIPTSVKTSSEHITSAVNLNTRTTANELTQLDMIDKAKQAQPEADQATINRQVQNDAYRQALKQEMISAINKISLILTDDILKVKITETE